MSDTTVNMLLLADDMLIIQENEDVLQKSTHEVQTQRNNLISPLRKQKLWLFKESIQFVQK
jgi:hypothetical protein